LFREEIVAKIIIGNITVANCRPGDLSQELGRS